MAPAPLCSGPGLMEVKKGEGLLEVLGREGNFEAVKPLPVSPSLPGSYSWVSCAAGTRVPVIGLDHSRGSLGLHGVLWPWRRHGPSARVLSCAGFWVERTPVHEAAQRGETLQLQRLIESGACVNQVTVDSITPLHAASLQGQAQCVQLLLAAGAQVDARNIDGSTPLCDACASGSVECVKLLLAYGAKVNPPLYTASPLHEACMSGSSECVRLLIDVGANLEAHDCHFGTPLHVACAREHLDCVKMLLNAGANVNAAKLHETALHHAAKVKNVDLIEMLVEFGGNIYARDNRGKKPSDYTWSSSAPAKCLEFYEKTPLTLSQLCRVSLRRATGVRGLEKITKLNIPPRLIDYLSYN
ncbi:ankyrin repeat and SOCS box protein 13 isoform X1 [Lutra lutra]|uniref:ankyrin repeat and SOCS box protein 13 isoform X1 n=1 Tax=Lutra lutra TaxID=9657 RepID=UPI001FD4385F|nr:ankyrin repeat and SOCS box protein 13 isoform X1 [Lutra lutra]